MRALFFLLLMTISLHSVSKNVQAFYFAKNGLYLNSEKGAYIKIERHERNSNNIELVYYSKIGGAWREKSSINKITRKKDNKFLRKVENQGALLDKTIIELVDTIPTGFLIREYDGDVCIMEAQVKRLFPTIYDGKATYFSRKNGEPTDVKYFYNNLAFKPVKQPKTGELALPKNSAGKLPEYPGGINQFVHDVYSHTLLPSNTNLDSLKGTFFLSVTIDSLGRQTDQHFINSPENFITKAILKGSSTMIEPWMPAVSNGKNTSYTYIFPFQFSANKEKAGSDRMPRYPGGERQLMRDIATSVRYPMDAMQNGVQGKVFVSFIIDTEGKVRDAHVVRSVYSSLDAEAIRVVRALPRWIPGEKDGKKVRVSYTVPIDFVLTRSSSANPMNMPHTGSFPR